MMMKARAALAAVLLLLAPAAALAQSSPNLSKGQVPTAGQWNSYFAAKQDVLGYVPLSRSGGVMSGPLGTAPSSTTSAGFNLAPGGVPTTPNNGDMWITSSGLFVQVNGSTVGPLGTGGGGGAVSSVANSDGTLTISPTTGAVVASLNLAHANTWTANQVLTNNTNGTASWAATNNSAGTSAVIAYTANNGTSGASFGIGGTGYTGVAILQGRGFINSNTPIVIDARSTSNPIIFATNDVEAARVLLGLSVGTTTDPGAGLINVLTGYRIGNAATSGNVLRGDGTNFISAQLAFSDLSGSAAAGQLPLATTGAFGAVKPDGSSITILAGVISAPGSGGGTVSNCAANSLGYWATTSTTISCLAPATSAILVTNGAQLPSLATSLPTSFAINASNITWSGIIPAANVAATSLGVKARLTLQSGVPVMTTSQTAKTTLYADCYGGASVIYFDGTNDIYESISSCEVSTAMAPSGTGVLNAGGVFDVWWVHGGANRICVATNGSGGGWASDTGGGSNTARGTGYSQIDLTTRGYPTNKNALANCYNGATNYGSVAANRATYLGTICTDAAAAGTVSHTLGGSSSGGTAGRLCVWNMWNRASARAFVADTGASHIYAGAIRQCSNLATMQVTFVAGLAEDAVQVAVAGQVVTAAVASSYGVLGYGLDSTTTNVKYTFSQNQTAVSISVASGASGSLDPQVGLHVFSCNESGDGVNNTTFVGGTINPQRIELAMPR